MTELASQRLLLVPLSLQALEALRRQDRVAAEAALAARWTAPELVPPLMTDALDYFSGIIAGNPGAAPWGARACLTRQSREVVGIAGFTGPPGETGSVTLGYSIFPMFQRQGFATEAAHILAEWALTHPGVRRIRATISPRNVASQRVAAAAGLQPTGATEDDPDEGPVMIWQRTREQG